MNKRPTYKIAVFPGDGIGPEITAPTIQLLQSVQGVFEGFELAFEELPAGAAHYRDHGAAFPESSQLAAREADAILLSAMGLPEVRFEDGTEISPQLDLRFDLNLYAGVRPIQLMPGLNLPLADPRAQDINMILVRESTEGLFASYGKGTIENDRVARETLEITRDTSERLFDFVFRLANRRKAQGFPGRVTCVDKANVFTAFAFFRKIFDQRAQNFADIETDYSYVDAMALNMVRHPWDFDVLVTENMFGDILSDLGAALMGGMGMAPSADIGDRHAVFQPCHGSAPDIAGQRKANPTAMFLSAAMMLDWLGDKHDNPDCIAAGELIQAAVRQAYAGGSLTPMELGGSDGLEAISSAVMSALSALSSELQASRRAS